MSIPNLLIKKLLFYQNPVHQEFSKRFMMEHTIEDRLIRLKRGKYAMLTKCLYEKHFMETETVPAAILNDLRTARTCVNQFYIGMSFTKNSPYVKPANLVIQRIFESGLIDYWLSRVIEERLISPATFKQVYFIFLDISEVFLAKYASSKIKISSLQKKKIILDISCISCP